MKRLALIFTLAVLASFVVIPSAFAATTTDLNNIPITDTLKVGTMEWDVQATYSKDIGRGRTISTRLFGALFENFEFGMAWNLTAPAGPMELAAKYTVLKGFGGIPVSVAVGVEGVTGNSKQTKMDPTYYAVIGLQDLQLIGFWDWYVGIANNPTNADNEDNSVFGGFKYWINDDLQFNADYTGYGDNEFYKVTAGLNYDLINHIGIQGWVERDSKTEDNYFVLQFVARADMRDLTATVSDPE